MQTLTGGSAVVTNSSTNNHNLGTAEKRLGMAELKSETMETKKDGVPAQQPAAQQQSGPQPNSGPQQHQGNRPNMPKMMGNRGGGYGGRGGGMNKRGSFGRKDRLEPYGGGRQGSGHGGGRGGGMGGDNRGNGGGNHAGNQFGQFFSMSGPTTNLPAKEVSAEPKKFTGRCRLFVGNLTPDITEEEFRKMFEPFGEYAEAFLNAQKGFGFIKMDTRANAENARAQLDGTMRKGRVIRVRLAAQMSAVRVRNLSPWVSNELLEMAFSLFGEVERAVVIVDERGKPVGEGIVEFARKPAANMALQRCANGNLLLTASPKPVIVEPLDQKDEEDGFPEKSVPKSSNYLREREVGPRFSQHGSFENEFSNKWKQLFEVEKQKRDAMEKEITLERERLEEQMELAIYEQETNMLREKLRQREQDANNLLREREMRRRDGDRMRDDHRHEDMMRRPHEEFMPRNRDVRRQQEDNLLMQANQLSNLLEQQEAAFRQIQSSGGAGPIRGAGPQTTPALGAGGPAGPVNSMDGVNMGGQGVGPGPNAGGMQMPRPNRFEQQVTGPPSSLNNQGNSGPVGHMGRGGGSGGGGGGGMMGNMGIQMGMGGGPMGGGIGGMGNRRDGMDHRRDHRDDYGDPKRRRY